ncbi:hypothetical protein GGS20DRAFT_584201 [Poronia punctata]|nr:hypothetical protein GGS20DRAFT_584201 [Poronia punctata]
MPLHDASGFERLADDTYDDTNGERDAFADGHEREADHLIHYGDTMTPEQQTSSITNTLPNTDEKGTCPKMWNSIWLRVDVLNHHGVSTTDATKEYGWRYGPTAVLTIVLGLWFQVDYSNKILTPWREMRQDGTPADRSLLLDYVSPYILTVREWNPKTLFLSSPSPDLNPLAREGPLTVFSTGLFVLESTLLEKEVPASVLGSFNGSDFHLSNISSSIDASSTILYYGTRTRFGVCKAGYVTGDYEASYEKTTTGGDHTVRTSFIEDSPSTIPGLPPVLLGAAVQSSLDQAYLGTGGQDWVLSQQVPAFYQILSAMNGNVSIGHFMEPQRLIDSGTEAFNGLAAQLIHRHMLKPSNTTVDGLALYYENRLLVRPLSVGFMGACFLLLAGLSVALVFIGPRDVVPCDPGSIGATALVLAESSALRGLLAGQGPARTRQIRQKLAPYHFRTMVTPGPPSTFTVEPAEHGRPMTSPSPESDTDYPSKSEKKWWGPASSKWPFQFTTVLFLLLLIVLLEVIQHISDQRQGFTSLRTDGFSTTHAFATYIPAVVAFLVSSALASMQLTVCILVPWLALHKGSAPASRSLFLNLTNRLAPHRMLIALQSGNIGVLLFTIATSLAAALPILVSGLYVQTAITTYIPLAVKQTDIFNFKQNNLFFEDNLAGTVTGLIAFNNLSYPEWTYGDLAFNKLDVPDAPEHMFSAGDPWFTTKVQAIRPSLSCNVVSLDRMTTSWSDMEQYYGPGHKTEEIIMTLNTTVPWMCEHPVGNTTEVEWLQRFLMPKNGSHVYFGQASALGWGPGGLQGDGAYDTDFNHPMATAITGEYAEDWVGGYGCPSFAVTVGKGFATRKVKTTKNHTSFDFDIDIDVASIMCFQHLESVDTDVTLSLSSLGKIPTDHPPVPDESTARYLVNKLSNYTGRIFEFPLNNFLLTLSYGTGDITTVAEGSARPINPTSLDQAVRFLATANKSLPIESLAGHRNAQNLIEASNRLYKQYMPQAINSNMRTKDLNTRVSTPDSVAARVKPARFTAQVHVPGQLRLRQQAAPKLAMQIVLAVMIVFTVAGGILLRGIDKVVPHNPCSIAGRASLFADGEVSTRRLVPYGAEWLTEAQLKTARIYDGWMFSLGWWESDGVYKYGVDIGWIDKGKTDG